MKSSLSVFSCIVLISLGGNIGIAQTFTNLDFESASIPSGPPYPPIPEYPPSEALPGWTVSTGDGEVYFQFGETYPGPHIILYETDAMLPGTAWSGAQGRYYVAMKSGTSPASISQDGYLSPGIKSLRFRVDAYLTDFVVSFAGQPLSCVMLSSVATNGYYADCAADVSNFAGTTGALKFSCVGPSAMNLDSFYFSTEPASSSSPPPGSKVAISKTGDSAVLVSFSVPVIGVYSLQSTKDLDNWAQVALYPATNSMFEFIDFFASNSPARFYRVVGPLP